MYRDMIKPMVVAIAILAACVLISNILNRCTPPPNQPVIDQLEEKVVDAEVEKEIIDESGKAQIDGIVDNHEKEKEKKKDVKERIDKGKKKVEEIEKNPGITQVEKDIAITEVLIDDLWESYCSTKGAVCPAT